MIADFTSGSCTIASRRPAALKPTHVVWSLSHTAKPLHALTGLCDEVVDTATNIENCTLQFTTRYSAIFRLGGGWFEDNDKTRLQCLAPVREAAPDRISTGTLFERKQFMTNSFDSALVQAAPVAHVISDGLQKIAQTFFANARGRPIAMSISMVGGGLAVYGAAKLIHVAAPAVKTAVGVTALSIRFGYDGATSTVRGWFSSTQTA